MALELHNEKAVARTICLSISLIVKIFVYRYDRLLHQFPEAGDCCDVMMDGIMGLEQTSYRFSRSFGVL